MGTCVKGLNLSTEQCLGIHATSVLEYSKRGFLLPQICLDQSIFSTSPTPTINPVSLISFRPSLGHPARHDMAKTYQIPLQTRDPFPRISPDILLILLGFAGGHPPRVVTEHLECVAVCCKWKTHTRYGRFSMKNKTTQ